MLQFHRVILVHNLHQRVDFSSTILLILIYLHLYYEHELEYQVFLSYDRFSQYVQTLSKDLPYLYSSSF